MRTLWFVMPAHGRRDLTAACIRQLARTCDDLYTLGIAAGAVVVSDERELLEVAADVGFATVQRDNRPLGRKWNDGFELAGRCGVDYVVPIGSDDWVDAAWVAAAIPNHPNGVGYTALSSVVSEDGTRLTRLRIGYVGGDGVRIIPTALLEPLRYRPADEDRNRAIDTSIWERLERTHGHIRFQRFDLHPFQIVDFKTDGNQLNSYADCAGHMGDGVEVNPWAALSDHYPPDAISEMRDVYARREQAVAA